MTQTNEEIPRLPGLQVSSPGVLDTGEIKIGLEEATQVYLSEQRLVGVQTELDAWMESYLQTGQRVRAEEVFPRVQALQENLGILTFSTDPAIHKEIPGLVHAFHSLVEAAPAVRDTDLVTTLLLLQDHPRVRAELVERSLGKSSAESWAAVDDGRFSDEQVLAGWIRHRRIDEGQLPPTTPNPQLSAEVYRLEKDIAHRHGVESYTDYAELALTDLLHRLEE